MSLTGLFLFRGMRRTPTWFPALLLIVAIVSTGLVSWAGVRGGVLRHTEVHGDALDFLAPTDASEARTPQQNLEIEAGSTQQNSGAEAGITQQELGTEASSPPQDSGNGSGHFDDGHTHED